MGDFIIYFYLEEMKNTFEVFESVFLVFIKRRR